MDERQAFYKVLYGPRNDEKRIEVWQANGRWVARSTAELPEKVAAHIWELVRLLNQNE